MSFAVVLWTPLPCGALDSTDLERSVDYGAPVFQPVSRFVRDSISEPVAPYELIPGKAASEWAFSIAPYGWSPALHSKVSLFEFPELAYRFGPIEVLSKLDWAVFLRGEVRKGRWGVLADGMYARFSLEADPKGPLYKTASATLHQSIDSLALAFRVVDDKRGFLDLYAGGRYYFMGVDASANPSSAGIQQLASSGADRIADAMLRRADEIIQENKGIAVEALVDRLRSEVASRAREWIAENPPDVRDLMKLKKWRDSLEPGAVRDYLEALAAEKVAQAKGTVTEAMTKRVAAAKDKLANAMAQGIEKKLPRDASQDQWWIDPIIGIRAQINFTHWLYLSLQGDVGGFGAGSEIAWFAQAALGANLTRNTSLELGYRYMYFDYTTNAFAMTASMPGFYGGMVFRF